MIENGGHGGTAAAPAALKVFEQYFHAQGAPDRDDLLRLMADLVYSAELEGPRAGPAAASSPRRRRSSRGSTG